MFVECCNVLHIRNRLYQVKNNPGFKKNKTKGTKEGLIFKKLCFKAIFMFVINNNLTIKNHQDPILAIIVLTLICIFGFYSSPTQ